MWTTSSEATHSNGEDEGARNIHERPPDFQRIGSPMSRGCLFWLAVSVVLSVTLTVLLNLILLL